MSPTMNLFTDPQPADAPPPTRRQRRLARRMFLLMVALLLLWIGVAYFLLPLWWQHRELWHPAVKDAPQVTTTADGIPGDPLNVLIIGPERKLVLSMLNAQWRPADPITLASSLRITESTVLRRSYETAPVSNLYLFGRKEDLAFERQLGGDPHQRHHVRFWRAPVTDADGHEAWWGAVTFDRSVGFSHHTGQVTHHISPEVDGERDGLGKDLERSWSVEGQRLQDGFQARSGSNGGGDPWVSDGKLRVIHLEEE